MIISPSIESTPRWTASYQWAWTSDNHHRLLSSNVWSQIFIYSFLFDDFCYQVYLFDI